MSQPLLETRNLTKTFEGLVAVDGVSVSFDADQLHAIIGPNGAGKTTFFNLLTGALEPTDGTIHFDGENITNESPVEIARRGLVRSYQETTLFDQLSVLENVAVAVQSTSNVYDFWTSSEAHPEILEEAEEILNRLSLAEERDQLVANLSHGDQRTLEIAVVLGTDPDLLLLDEPSSGMSPEETSEVIELVEELSEDLPIVLIEHKMSVVMQVSDRIMVLHNGQKIADGSPSEVRNDQQVQEVYLGSGT
jgi:branched-chain amino acid transport system ATP-binding protein